MSNANNNIIIKTIYLVMLLNPCCMHLNYITIPNPQSFQIKLLTLYPFFLIWVFFVLTLYLLR